MKNIEIIFRNYSENDFSIIEVIIKASTKKIFNQIEPNFKIYHQIDEKITKYIRNFIKNENIFVKIEINKNYNEKIIVQKIYLSKKEEINFKPIKDVIAYTPIENLCNHCIMKKECFEKNQKQFSRQRCKNFIEK